MSLKRFAVTLTPEQIEARIAAWRPPPAPVRITIDIGEPDTPIDEPLDTQPVQAPPSKRPHLVRELDGGVKQMVMSKLSERLQVKGAPEGTGPYRYSLTEVIDFFKTEFPDIGNRLKKPTLHDWRTQTQVEPTEGPDFKLGRPYVLAPQHRLAAGLLLKQTAAAGSPMNSKIARGILLGYLQASELSHLYSKKAAPGKISLTRQWIACLFADLGLSDRKATTDQKALPQVRARVAVLLDESCRTGSSRSSIKTTASPF
jgi:hypothetical protein